MIDLGEAERIGKAARGTEWSAEPSYGDFNDHQIWTDSLYLGEFNTRWIGPPDREACRDFCVYARNNWQAMVEEIRQTSLVKRAIVDWLDARVENGELAGKSDLQILARVRDVIENAFHDHGNVPFSESILDSGNR